MKCTIPGANVKVLARAIQALARIGDELYVEPEENSISFRSVNSSRSAYASFTFNRSFFAFYKHEPSQSLNMSQEENSKCKISMKSCLPVFRSPVMLDRKVENCIMRLEDEGSKLVFEMRFRHGISKTHFLPVIECETLQVVYTKENSANCLHGPAQLFSDTVHNFNNAQEEVTLAVTSQKTYLRTYVEGAINPSKMKFTEISLDPAEFDKYVIKNAGAITFCLKEFRALLLFAEATGLCIEAYFEIGGKPVLFGVKHESSYEANFVLSTLNPELEGPTPTSHQLRAHNSNTPTVISAATTAKEHSAQSNSKSNPAMSSKSNMAHGTTQQLQQETPVLQPDAVHEISRLPVRRMESPSLLLTKSGRSLQNSSLPRTEKSRLDSRCQQLRKATNSSRERNEEPALDNSCATSQERRQNSIHEIVNRTPNGGCGQSEEATPQELSSTLHDMNTPPIIMSDAGSVTLQRESDEEDNELIPSSPQPVRKRPCLRDIFDSTFNPNAIPGHDIILVYDSGDEQL